MSIFGAFSVQARHIAMALVGWSVVSALAGPAVNWASLAATAVATVVGYLRAPHPAGFDGLWDALKMRRLRRRYRVIEGGRPPAQEVRELIAGLRRAAAGPFAFGRARR